MERVVFTNNSGNLHFLGKLLEFVRFLYYYNNTILSDVFKNKFGSKEIFLCFIQTTISDEKSSVAVSDEIPDIS